MSVQEYKQRLHEVIERVDDESVLRTLLDTANEVLGNLDILDDLTQEQLAGLMEAREQGRQGNYITLDEFKRRFEKKRLSRRDILDDLGGNELVRINESMEQIKQGRTIPGSQVRQQAMEWLRKQ